MRREHIVEQSYIDWLKSLGCVFYAPLAQDDLKDYISGNIGTLTGYGSMSWDSNENMYMFTSPSQADRGVLSFDIGIYLPTSWTVMAELKCTSVYSDSCLDIFVTRNNNSTNLANCVFGKCTTNGYVNIGTNMIYWDNHNSVFRGTSSDGNADTNFYENGEFYFTRYNYTGYITAYGLPTNIDNIEIAAATSNAIYQNKNYYIKNLMIFNQALDLNIMNEIAGL